MTADDFIALPDQEKERIYKELDAMTSEELWAESRPPNKSERAKCRKIQAVMRHSPGRPKIGKGVKKVSVSIERSLLDHADAYAKALKMKRSELCASGVARLIGRKKSRVAS